MNIDLKADQSLIEIRNLLFTDNKGLKGQFAMKKISVRFCMYLVCEKIVQELDIFFFSILKKFIFVNHQTNRQVLSE